MARYYCTYFDRNYLIKGLALIDSLRRQETEAFTLYVVCLDEITRTLLNRLGCPEVVTVPIHELERDDESLRAAKLTRSLTEYYWTLTPTVVLRILERHPSIGLLTYLDADLYFFGTPQPIFDELGGGAVLIHEHRFSPAQRDLATHNGRYNVGWLSFRRNATGRAALEWWRARCLEWCYARYEDGKMGDQMYLNDWPTRFEDVVVLQHVGGGVGPWNHDQYKLSEGIGGRPFVDGMPVLFYHFHSFTMINPDVALPVKHPHYPVPQRALTLFFLPYVYAIERAAALIREIDPGFSAGLHNEEPVTERHTIMVRHRFASEIRRQGIPQTVLPLDHEWDALCSPQVQPQPTVGQAAVSAERHVLGGPTAGTKPYSGANLPELRSTATSQADELVTRLSALARVVGECRRLEGLLAGAREPHAFATALRSWLASLPDHPDLGRVIEGIRNRSLAEIAHLPGRLRLASHYVGPVVEQLLEWIVASNETTNFTYDLTELNKEQLAWFIAAVASASPGQVREYIRELESDEQLRDHVRAQTVTGPFAVTSDPVPRYGRRMGWYALVRAMKPRMVVETGVDKGLGTCVLAAALLRNQAEGFAGRLYATDIDPKAGYLFKPPYSSVGSIIYGDSVETLNRLEGPIDLFISDSAHEPEYEAREYACVEPKLARTAIVLSDNAHASPALAAFAERTGRPFHYFREQPRAHFYPGAGIGAVCMGNPTHPVQSAADTRRRQSGSAVATIGETRAPRISVIVSSYNAQEHIWECLEDLQRQTISEQLEIIVVDAASPQQERVIIEAFQQRYGNITFVRTPVRIGVYAAWNMALRLARGTYVTPFSTNDRLNPEAYSTMAQALDAHPDVMLVYGDTHITRNAHESFERHTRVGTWRWPEYSYADLCQRCLVGPHPMWRRAIHDEIGYFDESYVALGDQEFWLRLGARHRLLHLPFVTGLYWMSAEGLSNRPELAQPEERRLRSTYGPGEVRALSSGDTPAETRDEVVCSVIVPVWNRCELTRQCVTALAATTHDVKWELIVVDNGSSDETQSFLAEVGGDIRVIRNDQNLGFAKACNQGAAAAQGKYLIFLNNDTVPLNGWLKAMVAEVEANPEVAVVGSKLLFPDGTIQHAGVVFSKFFHAPYHIHMRSPGDHPPANQRREFQAVTAACMLVRRERFNEVGGFDEGYQNGFEDVDLCLKIREKGGIIIYQPASVLYHLEGQSAGRRSRDAQNIERLRARWGHQWWLPDEDIYYVEDGYAAVVYEEEGRPRTRLEALHDPAVRAQWQVVASAQRYARRQDLEGLRRELSRPESWPQDLIALQWAAALCKVVGIPDRAASFWERILALGEDAPARAALAQHELESGRFDAAAVHLEAALAHAPTHAQAWFLRGVLEMQRKAFEAASRAFELAWRHGAEPRKAQLGLCMAFMGQGRVEAAWDMCLRLGEQNPDDQEVIHWVIRSGVALERWPVLAERLARYVARNPADLSTRFAYASVLVRLGQFDAAKREHDTIQALNPTFDGLPELAKAVANDDVYTVSADRA